MDVVMLIKDFGLPVGLLLMLLLALYQGVKQAAGFFAPIAQGWADEHKQMMRGLRENADKQTVLMGDLCRNQNSQGDMIEAIHTHVLK